MKPTQQRLAAMSTSTLVLSMTEAEIEKFPSREVDELQILFPRMLESSQSDFGSESYEVLKMGWWLADTLSSIADTPNLWQMNLAV